LWHDVPYALSKAYSSVPLENISDVFLQLVSCVDMIFVQGVVILFHPKWGGLG